MACQHLTTYYVQPTFLSPQLTKTTWVCLHDGCFKLKKNLTKQQLITHGERLQYMHRVMIHCETLEIFCTMCKKQLFDEPEEEDGLRKSKKSKLINPYHIRQYLMTSSLSQNMIYAGQAQYPPSFQKEKRGLCGLKSNGINSYFNSVLHLLAYIPTIRGIFRSVNPLKIENQFVRMLIETISTIWSGQYRIINVDKMQKLLTTLDSNFMSYLHKTPQQVLYFILRYMIDEFYFYELPCGRKEMIHEPYDEWTDAGKHYNIVKQTFGGECVLDKICATCGNKMTTFNKFECLKVSYQKTFEVNYKGMLYALIEQALNWRNSHQLVIDTLQEGNIMCDKCQNVVKQFNSYVNLPNNLILEFGQDINGLSVELPDSLDLSKFTQKSSQINQDQIAVFDYIGCISRRDKHYYTHVKNYSTKKEHLFCDENIQEQERPNNNIKLALYKRRSNPKVYPLQKNILSCLEVGLNPVVPLPDCWSIYLKEHYHVPPLMNPFICFHGKLKTTLQSSKLTDEVQKIPVQIYQYLLETFGGRSININKQQDFCLQCQEKLIFVNQIKSSEKEMAAFADKLSHKKDWVYINRTWLQKWKKFVYSDYHKGYRMFGHPRPGPINNEITNQQQVESTFKKISPEVWYFLNKFYGGGPRFPTKKYHPNVVVTTSVDLRFESLRERFQQLSIKQAQKIIQIEGYKIEELQEQHLQEQHLEQS